MNVEEKFQQNVAPGMTGKHTLVLLRTHLGNVKVIPLAGVKVQSFALPGFIAFEIIVLFA